MAGQIISRGEGTWLLRVFLGRDSEGKRKYLNETFHGTKTEAGKHLRELLRQKDTGVEIGNGRQTLNAYLDRWLEDVRNRVVFRTVENYESAFRLHVRPAIGMRPLGKLAPLEIQALYNRLVTADQAPTVHKVHAALHQALAQAVLWREIASNPADAVTLPKLEKQPVNVLTAEQVRTMIAKAREIALRETHLLTFLVSTGLRPSEAYALRWDDVNGDMLSVRRSLSRRGKRWKIHEGGKRKRSTRTIRLSALAVEALDAQRRQQAEERLKAGPAWRDAGLVFPGEPCVELGEVLVYGGEPERERTIVGRFKRLLEAAGLPDRRVYDLRHTWATNALSAGVNAKIVSEQLGHASVAFTLDTYAHVLPNMQAEAAAATDMLFRPVGTP